jgi:uncharacterized membrane protein YhaH (DUF805 family)
VTITAFNPFEFTGRIGRLQFVAYYLVIGVVIYLASVVVYGAFGDSWPSRLVGLANTALLALATFSYSVRRLHDIGHSGTFALLLLVPFVNVALALYLLVAPGTKGPNRYGTRDDSAVTA